MRVRPGLRPYGVPNPDDLPSNPFPGPWHDPLLIRTTLIEKDIIGLDPRYNWFTPFDFIPGVGAYTKGARGVKGLQSAYRLYGHGLGRFAKLKALEAGSDFIGIGSKLYGMLSDSKESPGRAVADTSIGGSKREDSRVTISSRGAKSPQTLKPFWSNGKPKCRKGYRYDFKRKMCVKKS